MGLFEKIFGKTKQPKEPERYFQTLTAYTPRFTSRRGALYESELVRSAMDARARHISKLKVEFSGSAKPVMRTKLSKAPNDFQTWSQFLYRLSTILDAQNTAFIIPIFDELGVVGGLFPALPSSCEIVEAGGTQWLRYHFSTGGCAAVRLSEAGILTKFQYRDDFFGENNDALKELMDLIHIQYQGIAEATKNSSTYRFIAQANNFAKSEDLQKERERFNSKSLAGEFADGGLLLFPNTYANIKQIENHDYESSSEELAYIRSNVERYFGVNEKVLANTATGDELDAFFNGAVEPFAIQLSEVLTRMLYTQRETGAGSRALVTANRLQYMSVTAKISMAQQLGDRGVLMIDEIRELFNYAPLPDGAGQHAPIRGEYYMVDEGRQEGKDDDGKNEDGKDDAAV